MNNTPTESAPSTRAGDLQSPSKTYRNATERRLQVAGTGAIALLAAAFLCAPSAFAQVKTEPKPPKPAPLPIVPTPAAPPVAPRIPGQLGVGDGLPVETTPTAGPAPRKLSLFETEVWPVEAAVQHLQTQLQLNKMEPLNILFGQDTKDLEVANLTLRNVSGADALQLIAASAGCTVEPMYSTDAQATPGQPSPFGYNRAPTVIGYTFRAKPKPATRDPNGVSPVSPSFGSRGPSAVFGSGATAVGRTGLPGQASSPADRLTRIYPLGAVSTATKFPDLEKTLREIFKADGVAENLVSLALHEKTNVLVVNAAEPVHALVEQLLTALNTNTSQAERLSNTRDRAMGREELESALRAQKRLAEELAERAAQMRELQNELRRLQDSAQKPPSAK